MADNLLNQGIGLNQKQHISEIQGQFEIEDGGIQGISADDLRLCEEAFDLFDRNGSGTIDVLELKYLLRCFDRDCDD